ncbi:MAG: UvrD-helicase domain-containing protein [Chloroflexi bacterium]|nr:UvrD-helicase domain-containing protein [Chloroflexota bacterium]
MDILEKLNPAQRDAVQLVDGPVLVLAGPGSGKTRVLTHRVAYLIHARRIPAHNILAVTFTNKAAREMRERLVQLAGEAAVRDLTIGTFHATCARFLRVNGDRVGLDRGFAIYDEDDQTRLIKQILNELNLDDKKYRPGAVLGAISKAKNELIEPDDYVPPSLWHEAVRRAYARYQQMLAANNAVDFDDLLMTTVRLFRENPDVLERYQNRYLYLHVDEFQDTNMAQYVLVKLLADKYQNLFCVGDEDQCLPSGAQIQTSQGTRPIESLHIGDSLVVGAGRGEIMEMPIERIHSQTYRGRIVRICTQRGHTLLATPNHILFARLSAVPNFHYVYLMYRADRGYRIGLAIGSRSDGISSRPITGLAIRARQENADKVWILRVCRSRAEAAFYEQFYAFKYGIPTTLFHGRGRALALTEAEIARLYDSLDTRAHAAQLMSDLGLFPEFPHHRPKAVIRGAIADRKLLNFKLFGDCRRSEQSPWTAHRVSLNTTDRQLEADLKGQGYHTRAGRRQTWRLETSNLDYDKAEAFLRQVSENYPTLEIVSSAFFTDTKSEGGETLSFDFQPASHIRPTMIVPVFEKGRIVEDTVTESSFDDYDGLVFDLDVPKVRNYIADGIVVHNSVYGWRGADYRNVLRFSEDFPNAQTRLLEQNYRSTQTILDAAQAVIRKNRSRHKKELWTENPRGVPLTHIEVFNDEEEAQFVVDEIARLTRGQYRPRDIAVFYRTNFQSRGIEDAFVRRGMKYQLIGSLRFYQRREIKDVLAYLRLIANPHDSVAFMRVLNVPPRGIGKKTMDDLAQWSRKLQVSQYTVLQTLKDEDERTKDEKIHAERSSFTRSVHPSFDSRSRKALLAFAHLLDSLRAAQVEKNLSEVVDAIIQKTSFDEYVRDGTEEGEDRWGNITEMRRAVKKYASVPAETALVQYLEEVALVSDLDSLRDDADAATLMTLHSAKGLEFPVVFMVGLEEGLFPHSRSFDDPAQMEEERRLCYVGITRAKDKLYLVNAFRRTTYGTSEASEPSRFLKDIPRELLASDGRRQIADHRPTTTRERYVRDDDFEIDDDTPRRATRHASPAVRHASPVTRLRAGDRVHHATFGEGVVVTSKALGDDEEVEVAFVGKGVKRLLASLAGLKKK